MMQLRRRQSGLSYLEVVIATGILAISLVPMLEGLQTALLGTDVTGASALAEQRVVAGMEEMLAESFAALDAAALAAGSQTTPSSYSEAPGTPDRRIVYLSRYDGDNADGDNQPFTGVDAGLIWIRVEIEGTVHGLEALTAP